jgi:hypothetical protein
MQSFANLNLVISYKLIKKPHEIPPSLSHSIIVSLSLFSIKCLIFESLFSLLGSSYDVGFDVCLHFISKTNVYFKFAVLLAGEVSSLK